MHTGIHTAHDDKRRPLTADVYQKEQLNYPNIAIIPIADSDPEKLMELLIDLEAQDETHAVYLADNGAPPLILMMLQQKFDSSWMSIFDQLDSDLATTWNACLGTAWRNYGPWCNIALLNEHIKIGPRFMSALAQGLRKNSHIGGLGPTPDVELHPFGLVPIEDAETHQDQVQQLLKTAFMVRGEMASWYRFPEQDAEEYLLSALSERQQQVAVSYDTHVM